MDYCDATRKTTVMGRPNGLLSSLALSCVVGCNGAAQPNGRAMRIAAEAYDLRDEIGEAIMLTAVVDGETIKTDIFVGLTKADILARLGRPDEIADVSRKASGALIGTTRVPPLG